jgi:hypothetical protein
MWHTRPTRQVLAVARLAYVHMLEPACKKKLGATASQLHDLELDARKGEVSEKETMLVGAVADLTQELVELKTLMTQITGRVSTTEERLDNLKAP